MRVNSNDVKQMPELTLTPAVLTIAGYDPSSGAGITADLEVFRNHGVWGVSAVTALTAQAKSGVRRVEPTDAALLLETLDLLAKEVNIAGLKIGMLATAELAQAVTKFLLSIRIPREYIVLDPIVRSTSGAELLDPAGVQVIREELLPRVGWVTPNVDEAAILAQKESSSRENAPDLARAIALLGGPALNVVITGGHLDPPDDFLFESSGRETWIPGPRIEATSVHGTHGTGCVFSSALLCHLFLGDGPVAAVRAAKEYVRERLRGLQ